MGGQLGIASAKKKTLPCHSTTRSRVDAVDTRHRASAKRARAHLPGTHFAHAKMEARCRRVRTLPRHAHAAFGMPGCATGRNEHAQGAPWPGHRALFEKRRMLHLRAHALVIIHASVGAHGVLGERPRQKQVAKTVPARSHTGIHSSFGTRRSFSAPARRTRRAFKRSVACFSFCGKSSSSHRSPTCTAPRTWNARVPGNPSSSLVCVCRKCRRRGR